MALKPVDGQWGGTGSLYLCCEGVTALFDHHPATASVDMDTAKTTSVDADFHREFEETATPILATLFRIAWRLTGNTADAEDLLQDTMVRAYSAFPALQSQTYMKAWFVRIMRNIWIDDYRRSQRRPVEWLTDNIGDVGPFNDACREHSTRDAVEGQVIGTAPDTEVTNAFRSLPADLRRAMYYAYVEGFPYKEIARIECIPVGTVMSRLYRGRRRMRVLLPHLGPDF